MQQNRAILLTPPGTGAIAVVRILGPEVRSFIEHHFSRNVAAARLVHGQLRDRKRIVDDPVIMLAADGSFADINLHGGLWVVEATLELARRAGFETIRLDSAAPLPPDAVDADSDIEREVLMHLPLAKTEPGVRVLLAQANAWEALESSPVDRDQIERMLADRSLHWLLYPPRVAIVGAPNVGKSTLANQLFAQERSITADLPGTTRDWVGEIANIDGLAVMLIDTPGARETPDEIEREAIRRSASQVARAEMIILVLDAAQPLEPEQAGLMQQFPQALLVVNKTDRPAQWDIGSIDAIRTIATTGVGVDALRRAIRERFDVEGVEMNVPRCWTDRQRRHLQELKKRR